jgi:hypothetical protein
MVWSRLSSQESDALIATAVHVETISEFDGYSGTWRYVLPDGRDVEVYRTLDDEGSTYDICYLCAPGRYVLVPWRTSTEGTVPLLMLHTGVCHVWHKKGLAVRRKVLYVCYERKIFDVSL